MRRIVVAVMGTVSGIVLLFSYHTSTNSGAAVATLGTAAGGAAPGGSASTAPPAATSPTTGATASPPPGTTTTPAPASPSGSYTGSEEQTRWGIVQVEITVQNGKITAAKAVQYPQNNGRDKEINSYAVPALNDEVLQAQSAKIDAISGATVTSDGYLQSLQSAIDQAHL